MIDFALTDEQKMLKESISSFFKKECPNGYIREKDEKEEFPHEIYNKIAEMGLLGLAFPEEYGGSNGTIIDIIIALEEIARGMYAVVFPVASNMVFAGDALVHFGSVEQKRYYLPKMAKGEILFAFALTEPNAGSDAVAVQTTAVPDGNHYIINGNKIFSSFAHVANQILVLTRTDKTVKPHKGLSMFIVDPENSGVEINRLKVIGRRAEGLAEIFFEDVRIPKENLVGGLNEAWRNMGKTFERERAIAGAPYVGGAQKVVDEAVEYAKSREQFGQPISRFQAISHLIADMQTEVDAARLLVYYGAWRVLQNLSAAREVCEAKLKAAETFAKVANDGMQILGGYGYTLEYDMQRHWRDARIGTVAGGSSQIQREVIARTLGLYK
ncbi:MAG: acyl-CoA dehydrogenase family protein [Thermodesulfobacteriota bacterium]|nr:acyl-CoA dehydrogenase family protein [Thermodesulfobacteriota bacterium]